MNKQKFQFNYTNALTDSVENESVGSEDLSVRMEKKVEIGTDNDEQYRKELEMLHRLNASKDGIIKEKDTEIVSLKESLEMKNAEITSLTEKLNVITGQFDKNKKKLEDIQQAEKRAFEVIEELQKVHMDIFAVYAEIKKLSEEKKMKF